MREEFELGLDLSILMDSYSYPEPTTSVVYHHVEIFGGNNYNEGGVYATNSNGYHGPVCDHNWGNNEANVVCRYVHIYSISKSLD